MPDITHAITIRATPARVYAAVMTSEGIRKWWTRDAVLDARIGGSGEFGFVDRKVVTRVRVDELMPPTHVRWTTISSNAPGGWAGTTITFDLRAESSGTTTLSFAHRGLAQSDSGYALVAKGWSHYLVSLQQYLQTGHGTPA
jgi:uncharacterized protein YndB with AHSA1/START domain